MRTANSLSRAWLVILTLILGSTATFAEAPNSAVEFNATVMSQPNGGAKYVLLSWYTAQDGALATSFEVYIAKGETEDHNAFDKIGTVEARADEPRGKYTFEVRNLDAGVYTFYVIAVNADGPSERTRIKVVNLNDNSGGDKLVKFITEPKRYGVVGTAYRYEAKAFTNTDGTITYDLTHGPDGMEIDAATGLVSWATPRAGRYEIRIVATVMVGGVVLTAVQEYVLEIKGEDDPRPDACVTITGKVTFDGTIESVMNGVVIAWRTHGDDPANVKYVPVYKAEVRQGYYKLQVPAGNYKLRIEGPSFIAEWYADVQEIADATTVEAVCATTPQVEINFSVEGRPEPITFIVTGRITDAVTGEGLKGFVKFDAHHKADAHHERHVLHVMAETNAEGYYEVRLIEGIAFIAYAQSAGVLNTISLYLGEYWQETGDVTAATLITLTENLDGINFTLEHRPDYDNGFSGRLLNDETGEGVKGKVTAYLVKSNDHKELDRRWSVTVETDEEGYYAFENLIPGNYVVLGTPAERPLVPGWYVAGGKAELKWQHSTQVEVGEATMSDGHHIRLHAIKEEHGRGRIHGWVFHRRGGIVAPVGNVKDDAQVQVMEENGIIGALVIATVNGEVVDFAFSENDGAYELSAMGTGDAILNINRFDFDHVTFGVSVDGLEQIDQQQSFGLDAVVSGVEVPVDRVGKDVGLYPNPAATTATVSFSATTGTAVIKVVDMTGVVMFTNVVDVTTGQASAQLNLSSLPAGMVMVHVSNGTSTFALPLSIIR